MRSEVGQKLVEEFPELLADDVVLTKEVYAHFGLAFFKFALVEHSLINVFVFASVGQKRAGRHIQNQGEWEFAFDEAYKEATSKTFGNLVKVASDLPEFSDIKSDLQSIKNLRDYFAHHFMREESGYFSTNEGCWFLLEKIKEVRSSVLSVEEMLKPRFSELCKRFGFPQPEEEQLEAMVERYSEEFAEKVAGGNPKVGWEDNAL